MVSNSSFTMCPISRSWCLSPGKFDWQSKTSSYIPTFLTLSPVIPTACLDNITFALTTKSSDSSGLLSSDFEPCGNNSSVEIYHMFNFPYLI